MDDYIKKNSECITHSPWMEKYRPSNFEEIVLDPLNKKILKNTKFNKFTNINKALKNTIDWYKSHNI